MSQNDEQKSRSGRDQQYAVEQEKQQRMMFKKLLRRKRRKEREAEGEIKELNITAMMDMMTIILVFLLKSYSATSINMASSGELAPPISTTRLAPKDTVAVTVTRCSHSNAVLNDKNQDCKEGSGSVMVMDKLIFKYNNDRIPSEFKQGGKDGMLIVPLRDALVREVDRQKKIASYNRAAQLSGELSVVGDKRMPYRMLTEILYTAGQAELDNYRFVVIKSEGTTKTGG